MERGLSVGGATALLAIVALVGCSENAPAPVPAPVPPTAPAPDPVAAPAPAPAPDPDPDPVTYTSGPCTSGELVTYGHTSDRRASSIAAFDQEGGLVGYTIDPEHVAVIPVDVHGNATGEAVEVEMPGARDIIRAFRLGEHFVIVSHAICASGNRKCLHLRSLDAWGVPAAESHSTRTGEWMTASFWAEQGDSLLLFRAHTYLPPALDRFTLAADGSISHAPLAEIDLGGRELNPDVQALGFAIEGARWAAWVEASDAESGRTLRTIYREGSRQIRPERPIPLGNVYQMAFEGDRLRVLYTPRDVIRPSVMYFDEAGSAAPGRRLASDEAIAGNRTSGGFISRSSDLAFVRRDVVGRPVGAESEMAQRFDRVDGVGGHFLARRLTGGRRGKTLLGQAFRCEETSAEVISGSPAPPTD